MAESKSSGGIGFLGLLAIVLITLKLCGVIDWYWWWVLFYLPRRRRLVCITRNSSKTFPLGFIVNSIKSQRYVYYSSPYLS